jgi:transcriptional regulator with GAF, ATPase, and Fis domain
VLVSPDQSLVGLANLYATVGGRLTSHIRTDDALAALTATAVQMVPGAEHAGITRGQPSRFQTVAATSDLAMRTDAIQYELGSGPCVDAVLRSDVFRTGDLREDPRWPEFGPQAFAATGVVSMLSFGVFLEAGEQVVGLNMYATNPDAFDAESETVGTLLATHGGLAVAAASAFERVGNLEVALASNREVGVAMGVLMNQHKITREQAFDLLRIASQHGHRKLVEIATEVADTGTLALPGQAGAPAGPVQSSSLRARHRGH